MERRRRARINEALRELRLLLAGQVSWAWAWVGGRGAARRGSRGPGLTHARGALQVQAKLENAEVLELTVRRVQGALRGRARGE